MNYEHIPPEQLSRAIDKALKVLKELQQDSEHMGPFRADILSAFNALANVECGIVEPEPITFLDLYRHLPFATSIKCDNTRRHIVNDSVFPVRTLYHVIERGYPLCGRDMDGLHLWGGGSLDECPGCLAKGRALAAKAAE